jgi:hypothetical protein
MLAPGHGCGMDPRRQRRGWGKAANLTLSASKGALYRKIDHYSFPAFGLSCGHVEHPFLGSHSARCHHYRAETFTCETVVCSWDKTK